MSATSYRQTFQGIWVSCHCLLFAVDCVLCNVQISTLVVSYKFWRLFQNCSWHTWSLRRHQKNAHKSEIRWGRMPHCWNKWVLQSKESYLSKCNVVLHQLAGMLHLCESYHLKCSRSGTAQHIKAHRSCRCSQRNRTKYEFPIIWSR